MLRLLDVISLSGARSHIPMLSKFAKIQNLYEKLNCYLELDSLACSKHFSDRGARNYKYNTYYKLLDVLLNARRIPARISFSGKFLINFSYCTTVVEQGAAATAGRPSLFPSVINYFGASRRCGLHGGRRDRPFLSWSIAATTKNTGNQSERGLYTPPLDSTQVQCAS